VINQAARWTIGSKPNANSGERPEGEREGVDPMRQMTAMVLTAEGRLVLERRPVPTPRADQVLVDVELCGICGSDLHAPDLPQVYRGGFILGHEPVGRIAAVGQEVTGWRVGQRVSINPNGDICGVCAFCRTGRFNFCVQATLERAWPSSRRRPGAASGDLDENPARGTG
jgi:threonine dehydrogenase-like Zn-dependent dehydrogenase